MYPNLPTEREALGRIADALEHPTPTERENLGRIADALERIANVLEKTSKIGA